MSTTTEGPREMPPISEVIDCLVITNAPDDDDDKWYLEVGRYNSGDELRITSELAIELIKLKAGRRMDKQRADERKPIWVQTEPNVMRTGDIGGDVQISESFGVRFVHASLPGRVVDLHYYLVDDRADGERDQPRLALQLATTTTICTDITDPGSTEKWSDTVYSKVADANAAWTEADVALRAGNATPHDIKWDGDPSFVL